MEGGEGRREKDKKKEGKGGTKEKEGGGREG
jgi:hypothetical protein